MLRQKKKDGVDYLQGSRKRESSHCCYCVHTFLLTGFLLLSTGPLGPQTSMHCAFAMNEEAKSLSEKKNQRGKKARESKSSEKQPTKKLHLSPSPGGQSTWQTRETRERTTSSLSLARPYGEAGPGIPLLVSQSMTVQSIAPFLVAGSISWKAESDIL